MVGLNLEIRMRLRCEQRPLRSRDSNCANRAAPRAIPKLLLGLAFSDSKLKH